ncbi:hypothetical protein F8S13_00735 [Chloroflexia bacterium SDU3-3]|nr:hypothetical protein F8S13_00735 [Chloroflexia bacterium SDU3-3]
MARIDAYFFSIRWAELGRLAASPWYTWSDEQGELLPACAGWLAEEQAVESNWKVAIDAAEAYTSIRHALPGDARAQADRLFGLTFGIASDDEWAEQAMCSTPKQAPQAADLSHSIGPALADELIALWRPALRVEIERAWLPRPQDTYINTCETLIGYAESWVALLRDIRARGEWGLLLALAY